MYGVFWMFNLSEYVLCDHNSIKHWCSAVETKKNLDQSVMKNTRV